MDVVLRSLKRRQKAVYKHHDQHPPGDHYSLWSRLETIDASQYVSNS